MMEAHRYYKCKPLSDDKISAELPEICTDPLSDVLNNALGDCGSDSDDSIIKNKTK
jgi:hypothetical protein